MWKYLKMAQIKLLEAIKTWYRQLWADYLIRNSKIPCNISIPGYLPLICHLRCCRWPISQILGLKGVKISQNGKIKLSEALKSWYRQLWPDYLIRNPITAYNVIIPGYLTLICYLRYCRWPISQILGLKSAKIWQNGPN